MNIKDQLAALKAEQIASILSQIYKINTSVQQQIELLVAAQDKKAPEQLYKKLLKELTWLEKGNRYLAPKESIERSFRIEIIRSCIADNLPKNYALQAFALIVDFIKSQTNNFKISGHHNAIIEVYHESYADLANIATLVKIDSQQLATIILDIMKNSCCQAITDIIIACKNPLGKKGLMLLQKTIEENIADIQKNKVIINYTDGTSTLTRLRNTLLAIADILQDAPAFARACTITNSFDDQQQLIYIQKLIDYGTAKTALQHIKFIENSKKHEQTISDALKNLRIDALVASGDPITAQKERVKLFETELQPKMYNQVLQYLDPADRAEFKHKAITYAKQATVIEKGLTFLMHINALPELSSMALQYYNKFTIHHIALAQDIVKICKDQFPATARKVNRSIIEIYCKDSAYSHRKKICQALVTDYALSQVITNPLEVSHTGFIENLKKQSSEFKYYVDYSDDLAKYITKQAKALEKSAKEQQKAFEKEQKALEKATKVAEKLKKTKSAA